MSDKPFPPKDAKPEILVDIYGNSAPKAAKFGRGISDRNGAREAADAQRGIANGQRRPGDYAKR